MPMCLWSLASLGSRRSASSYSARAAWYCVAFRNSLPLLIACLDLILLQPTSDATARRRKAAAAARCRWRRMLRYRSFALSLIHPGLPARPGVPNSVEFPPTKQQSFWDFHGLGAARQDDVGAA